MAHFKNGSQEMNLTKYLIAVGSVTLCLLSALGQTPPQNELRDLPPNQTFEREMTGGEVHRYRISLNKDEFLQLRIEQKSVDVSLKLLNESGSVIATMDSPTGKEGPEILSFVAAQTSSFTLEVSAPNSKAEKGNYSIRREAPRRATEKDKRRVEVERLYVEGVTAPGNVGQSEPIAKLKEALKGWRELEDSYLARVTDRQVRTRELIVELGLPNTLISEGNRLIREGKPESILSARTKFNDGLEAARKLFKRLERDDLSDILTKDNKANLRTNARLDEINALRGIGNTYGALRDWQESVNSEKQAITVIREVLQDPELSTSKALASYIPLKTVEASSLHSIGSTLTSHLDKPQEGLSYDSQALTLWREVQREYEKYRAYAEFQEALLLQTMGQSYLDLDDRDRAVACLEQALPIFRRLPDQKSLAASILVQLGNVYSRQLDYAKARAVWNEALKIHEELGDKPSQASVLGSIGLSYFNVNDEQKAREHFNRALVILLSDDYPESAMKERAGVSLPGYKSEPTNISVLRRNEFEWQRAINIANIYNIMGDMEKGREYFEKSLVSARVTKNQNRIRLSLFFIGSTYERQERWQEALPYYEQTLQISRVLPGKSELASDLTTLAGINVQLKRWQDALQHATEALLIYQSLGADKNNLFVGYAGALNQLARVHDGLGNRRLAIFYEKQAVNVLQRERQQLRNLDQESQRGYLKKNEKPYRRLADWLIAEGRILEAEQILAMLKEEEVFDYLHRDASEVDKLQKRADLRPEESDALKRYNAIADNITALGSEFGKLQELQAKGIKLTDEQQQRYAERSKQLEDASRVFQVFLRQLAEEFVKRTNTEKDLDENLGLKADLKSWGKDVVFLYTLTGDDRYRVILITRDTQVDGKYEIKAAELNDKIEKFRQIVQNPKVDPRPLGKELYDILIKPIEKQLEGTKARVLLWSLDGSLRLLPLAALWDGQQYFGQKYQNVTITLASRTRLNNAVAQNWRVLGLGVSEAKKVKEPNGPRVLSFDPLPAVRAELRSIVRTEQSPNGVLPGQSLLDADFNENAVESQLLQGYKVIHIASHFSLNPGDATHSFLLLGDGNVLTVDEIKNNPRLSFTGVELLTLSACQTAVLEKDSSGKEVEGFGYVAQQKGAKAILATLWSVADESTQLLMSEFYRLRKVNPQLTKAAALQMAQQRMIAGKFRTSKTSRGRRDTGEADAPPPNYSHPFYWSPFVLIGNWQ